MPLVQSDLYNLPRKVNVNENVEKFQREWNTYLDYNGIKFSTRENKKRARIWIPLIHTVGWRLLLANCLAVVYYSVVFLGPQVKINHFFYLHIFVSSCNQNAVLTYKERQIFSLPVPKQFWVLAHLGITCTLGGF